MTRAEEFELEVLRAVLTGSGKMRPGSQAAEVAADAEAVVICGPTPNGEFGTRQKRCECGALIWVTARTVAAIAKRGLPARLLCKPCGLAMMRKVAAE